MWLYRAGVASPTTVATTNTMEKKKKQSEAQVIVAMKGHPGTGKSTLARAVASSLGWPLLDKDDVRDCTQPLPLSQPLLNDLSYSVLFRLARTQLSLGLSLVLDSPLSRRAHLDLLLRLAPGARVAVVECRPRDEAEWRRRLEERGRRTREEGTGAGHKPATWEELQRLIEGYDGCCDYEIGEEVKRIVVDTTAGDGVDDVADRVVEFVRSLV